MIYPLAFNAGANVAVLSKYHFKSWQFSQGLNKKTLDIKKTTLDIKLYNKHSNDNQL